MSTANPVVGERPPAIPFPSVEWFRRLAELMNQNRALHEHLGYIDCVAGFTISDGAADGRPFSVQVTFEEFEAVDVREAGPEDAGRADFVLEADMRTWREMIESIARGGGRPDLTHTLNYLSHMGEPVAVRSDDTMRRDMYFRYNQSLQEFVNASAQIATTFREP
jgi:hypothetical protein